MLRRNLLKSLTAIIPISFLNKNVANEKNPNYVYTNIVETKSGKPVRLDRSNGYWEEHTYDENENELTCETSEGYWSKSTYDKSNNRLTNETSNGFWMKRTYNEDGKILTHKNSTGYWCEKTYNKKGQILSFKDNKEWIAYAEDPDGNTWEQSRFTYNV